jgi:hypothetical protein
MGPESSPPTSLTYFLETEPMASPTEPSTPTALLIEEDAEHAKQGFTTCFDDYCLIHKGTNDSTCYSQRPSSISHFGGPVNCSLHYLEPLLPSHANHHKWIRPQEPILGDCGCPN